MVKQSLDFPAKSAAPVVGGAIFFLFLIAAPLLRAVDLPPPYTIDFPLQANQATPVWLGHPETPSHVFAVLDLPITPPDPSASLLVTIFFQEKEQGFLRISWKGPQSAQMLSDNFYEGIAMNNQRSLLIASDTMQGAGTLSFQCGETTMGIQRVRLEWLENRTGLVSQQVQDVLVTPASGMTQAAQTLSGQPAPADAAAWKGRVVTVPLTDLPERIEQGVEYSVQMDNMPSLSRLALKESGLLWGQHLVVWINRKRAGIITPSVPDLLDDGFFTQTNAASGYVGWRDGSSFIPISLLKTGTNTILFSTEGDAAGSVDGGDSYAPLAVKNVALQLYYPPVATPVSSLPSISPTDSARLSVPADAPASPPDSSSAPATSDDASGALPAPASTSSTNSNSTPDLITITP